MKFSYTSKCSHKVKVKFKQLIGTLAKVQGIFCKFDSKMLYIFDIRWSHHSWNTLLHMYTILLCIFLLLTIGIWDVYIQVSTNITIILNSTISIQYLQGVGISNPSSHGVV